jgi:ADP-heptose:LPS heptosyltransferase
MKILFIRFSSIGDIVLTTPVIRCVKNQVPGADIHFLLKKSFSPVLQHNPYISKFHFFENNLQALSDELREENFDLIVDLQKNFRSFRVKQLLGIKSLTFDKLNFQKWLLVNFKINLLPKVHIVDRYMKSVSTLSVVNDGQGLDYFLSVEDENVLQSLPPSHNMGYVAWVIGAKHYTKKLPVDKMISIGQRIKTHVLLLGDQSDKTTGDQLAAACGNSFFNACGLFSLNQSAVLIRHAQKVITHDTGLMHIAAAFNKEIISVWGNTIPEFGMYPYYGNDAGHTKSIILEVKNISCRPCSKIGFEKCPRNHFKCMREIDEKEFGKL